MESPCKIFTLVSEHFYSWLISCLLKFVLSQKVSYLFEAERFYTLVFRTSLLLKLRRLDNSSLLNNHFNNYLIFNKSSV